MSKSYLITGGVRSGKSSFALNLATGCKKPVIVATGFACDDEMFNRIEKHKQDRSSVWTTMEEQTDLSEAILRAKNEGADFILVDCITMWLCNIMGKKLDYKVLLEDLVQTLKLVQGIPLAMVSNETGMGIVPKTRKGREFRDIQGFTNQMLAQHVSDVFFMIAGLPLYLKNSNCTDTTS